MPFQGAFSGYKTYIVAFIAIIGSVAGYLTGDLDAGAAFQAVITAVTAATIRNGIKTSLKP